VASKMILKGRKEVKITRCQIWFICRIFQALQEFLCCSGHVRPSVIVQNRNTFCE
jgi:hypothetical protein